MRRVVAVNERGLRIGEDHPMARYTNREIDMVFELRDEGLGYKRISKVLDMPRRTIRDVLSGARRCQTAADWKTLKD